MIVYQTIKRGQEKGLWLFELLVVIMKIIIESLNVTVEDIDLVITGIINQNKLGEK